MTPKGLSVTLVEPRYPVNLGQIARLLKNFGIERLYLVHPQVDMSVARIYASHASDILENAELVTLRQLRRKNDLLVATTAIAARKKSNVIRRAVRLEQVASHVRAAKSSSLVLGRDTTGLTNEEIKLCDLTVVVETGSRYKTLNIGHAAAIMLYVISRGQGNGLRGSSRRPRELFAKSFSELAASSRMPGHKLRNMPEIGKRIAAESRMTDRQLLLMSGVFRRAVGTIEELQGRTSKT
ncbi:MAG TPA: TrmH family RNA methyltransferase [Nitrososphaerales archaeon]|nr:TrmH family RNA methyltransferase [Nitrososphaerales archaeon]